MPEFIEVGEEMTLMYTKASKNYLLCESSGTEIWYSVCDNVNKHPLTVNIDPCNLSRGSKYNFSFSWIPRYDLINVHGIVDVWYKSIKVSGNRYIMCTGTDDEYQFCGSLKGETIRIDTEQRFTKLKFEPGTYIAFGQIMTADEEDEKVALCVNMTVVIKN
ncbi:lymphocyte antigen 96 [Rhinatrema bivittatum]|uniref:lymphocyte antigen 96 n=1 Tax=Rhinatrema bivittatum TaxID=194408 RepID=UPI001128CAA4|nr:lymphocyte antigen 96 [Rhinatrema bivittatum]